SIFENAAEGIFQTTEDGRFILANPSLARICGYGSREELTAEVTDIANQLHGGPEQRAEFKRQLDEQGSVAGFEVRFRRRDGAKIWIKINAGKKFDESRGLTYYEGTVEDSTERKHAEEALRESEERFRLLVENAPDSIFVATGQGLFAFVNPSALKLFGAASKDQLAGSPVLERIHPSCHETVRERIRFLMREKRQVALSEQKYITLDGTVVDVETSAVPITYEDNDGALVFVRDITERKQADDARRKNKGFLTTLLNAGPVRVFYKDIEGRYLGCNRAFEEFFGKTRDQLIGKSVFDINPRELAEIYHVKDAELLQNPGTQIYDSQVKDAYGALHDVVFHKATFTDADGRVLGLIGAILDITERKRAEQAMAEEAIRRRILIEQSRDGIAVLDQNGKVYEANQRFVEMLGYSAEEISQLHVWDWDVRWTQEALLERMQLADAEGDIFETRHRRKDGTIYDVEICSNGVELAGQKLVFCVCRDISQRKAAEQALREREHYFRSLLVNLHEDILVIDRSHKIIDSNKDFLYVIGQKREELVGRHCFDVLHGYSEPCSRHGVVCELETVFGNGHPCGCLHEHVRPDGRTVWVDMLYSLLKREVGGPDCAILTLRDVTHEVEIEKQLRHAQKMEAIGTLAGGIAHDFNNILGIILGYAELELLESAGSDESRDRVEEIRKAALRAKDLVQQILAFSRKHGQGRGPLQLGLLLKEVLKL